MSSNHKVIAIEGVPYAGKTTLINYAEKIGLQRLGELAESYSNGLGFPAFSWNDHDAQQSFKWFVEAEIKRLSKVEVMNSFVPVISDRSIVSSLAYSYARANVFKIGDFYNEALLIEKAIQSKAIFIPPLAYIRIDIKTFLLRRAQFFGDRCQKLGKEAVYNVTIPICEKEFFSAEIEYYEMIAKRLEKKMLVIDGSSAITAQLGSLINFSRLTHSKILFEELIVC